MIEILIFSFLITLLFTPFGIVFQKGDSLRTFSLQLIYGLILISFISLLINFFAPLNQYLNSIIIVIGLIIIVKFYKIYLNKKFLIFCAISSIIIFLLITESNVYRPDAGLYHLPYIRILNDEKIIIGLSNLHFRFGHTSIMQYLSAISNNLVFKDNGIVFPGAMVASSVIINFLSNINKYIKLKKYNFHFVYIFSLIIFIFYKMNRYSEYGNDAPSHFLLFILVSEIIKNYSSATFKEFSNYMILSIFIVMNKIILLISIIFPIVLLLRKIKVKIISFKTIFLLSFGIIWVMKNILVSGCFLYPVEISCIDKFSWTNKAEARSVSIENEAWAKGWPDYRGENNKVSQTEYSKNFFWLKYWSKNHFFKIVNILIPYLLFLFLIFFTFKFKFRKNNIIKFEIYLIFFSFLGCLLWFLKVPVFRYGYSYLIIFISLIFSYVSMNFSFKDYSNKIFTTVVFLGIAIFTLKNLHRIVIENYNYYNHPWPKFYSYTKKNETKELKFKHINNKKMYDAGKDYCMYNKSPCGYVKNNLKMKKFKNYFILINQ